MKRLLLTLMVVVSILAITGFTQQSKPQWEYKLEFKMNEKRANELGSQGWELAAIESSSSAGIGTNVPTYVFKRPK